MTLLLQDRRLVTVTGTGGVGKTRVALKVAEQVAEQFDTISFVELAPLRDFRQVPAALADALSIREGPSQPVFERIVDDLTSKRALLVLDNMEHLMPARELVADLLRACPNLFILVTSREILGVRGERVYTLGPLRLPERDSDIARSPAVRLFLDRAGDTGINFPADQATALAVAEICRRLDGVPLAIELAAAWTAVMSPQELVGRLSSQALLFGRGSKDLPERQRTVWATIDWSYGLLNADERTLLAGLSVFAGGFTLEAARSICQDTSHLDLDILDGLRSLSEKSLLTVRDVESPSTAQETRFNMLETVREFAYEQLQKSSNAGSTEWDHARYFLALAEDVSPRLSGPDQSTLLDRLERDHDNLRGALQTAQRVDDVEMGLRLSGAAVAVLAGS